MDGCSRDARPIRKAAGTNQGYLTEEYKSLPGNLRRSTGKLDMDEATMAIHEEIPRLGIETPADLADYFERQRTRRWQLAAARHRAS